MRDILVELLGEFTPSGVIGHDVRSFLIRHDCAPTAEHCGRVAAESGRIAKLVGVDAGSANAAGWLHDVSAVFPHAARADIARQLGIEVLHEEDAFPVVVHQKLSVVLARELFGVVDEDVLSAVGSHTTLKAGAGALDKVLFVADKVERDGAGVSPYRVGMLEALDTSLDAAATVYLHSLWEQRHRLRVVHPWLAAAHAELCRCMRVRTREET